MPSKVTTKRGDGGETTALSGDVYPKAHPVMECCGLVDSLRAHTALSRLQILESGREDAAELDEFLFWLLHTFFLIGTQCNDPLNKRREYHKEDISPKHLNELESAQADLEGRVDLERVFIASASNTLAAQVDVTCTVARDLERSIVALKKHYRDFDVEHILPFVNRLSDYLFILARHLEDGEHTALDYGVLDR